MTDRDGICVHVTAKGAVSFRMACDTLPAMVDGDDRTGKTRDARWALNAN